MIFKKLKFSLLQDSVQKHTREQMERLDQSINIIEEEAKRLIDAVVKKLESVQDVVTTEKSTNEEFRKVCQFLFFFLCKYLLSTNS